MKVRGSYMEQTLGHLYI